MNPAISQIAIMLVLMQVSKKIPFEDPKVLWAVRATYIVSNLLIFGLYFYTKFLITKKNDLTTLKYVEPANPLNGTPEKPVVTTVKQYDLEQVNSAIKSVFTGIAMMLVMHVYLKYTNPLLMQSILPLKGALEQKIVQIYVFKKAPIGDLKRPFKAANLLQSLSNTASGNEIKVDKKSIAEAEKSGHGGVKEE